MEFVEFMMTVVKNVLSLFRPDKEQNRTKCDRKKKNVFLFTAGLDCLIKHYFKAVSSDWL